MIYDFLKIFGLANDIPAYEHGGSMMSPDMLMVKSDLMKLSEYSKKINDAISPNDQVEAWVIAKLSKVEQTVANVKHTLEAEHPNMFAEGGMMSDTDSNTIRMMCLHINKYANSMLSLLDKGVEFDSWMKHELSIAGEMIDSLGHYVDYSYAGNHLEQGGEIGIKVGDKIILPKKMDYTPNYLKELLIAGKKVVLTTWEVKNIYVDEMGSERVEISSKFENRDTYYDKIVEMISIIQKYKKYEQGGELVEYTDLFQDYDNMPKNLKAIFKKYENKYASGDMDYKETEKFLKEVEAIGYTFDYYLDNEPYGLRPIGVKLSQLEGYVSVSDLKKDMIVYPISGSYAGKKAYVVKIMPDNKTIEVVFKHKVGNDYQKFMANELTTDLKYANGGGISSRYDKWAKNIYENQSEQQAREGLMQFASEEGFDYSDVEKALQTYKYDTEENAWGELYYTKKAVRNMISMIADEKFEEGGGVEATFTMGDPKELAKGGGIYSSDDRWVVIFQNIDSGEFEKVIVRANNKKNAIAIAEDESGLNSNWYYYSAEKEMAKGGGVGDSGVIEWTDMYDAEKYKEGGSLHIYKHGGGIDIHIVNEGQKYDESRYPAIFKDFDHDGTLNVEDIKPTDKYVKSINDEPKFSKVFSHLLNIKNNLDSDMYSFVSKLRDIADEGNKIYARTKTPFSILNKLVDKRLLDPKKGLTDLIGTTLEVNDKIELDKVKDLIQSGKLGKVVEFENFYEHPKDGYRAYHFLIEYNGHIVELQLKTKRMKAVNMIAHSAYKAKELDSKKMDYVTNLVDRADLGDKEAEKEFDDFLKKPNLETYFFKK